LALAHNPRSLSLTILVIDLKMEDDLTSLLNPLKRERKGSWKDRTFSEIRPGSVRGSIFTLTSTAIGAGALAMPLAVSLVGVVNGFLLINLTGFLAMFGLDIIVEATTHFETYSLSDLMLKLWGKTYMIALELTIILVCLGSNLAYLIIVGKTLTKVLTDLELVDDPEFYRCLIMIVAVVAVMLPLSMLKDLSGLRIVAIMSIATL
jgi:amino acid permease